MKEHTKWGRGLKAAALPVWFCLAALAGCGDDKESTTADVGVDGSGETSGSGDTSGSADAGADTGTDTGTDTVSAALSCAGSPATATVTAGSPLLLEVPVGGSTIGLSAEFEGNEVTAATDVTLACAEGSIVPEGHTAMSPAFTVTADTRRFGRRYLVTIPIEASLLPAGARPSAIRVYHREPGATETIQPLVINLQENLVRNNVRFETELLGEFQIGFANTAGSTYDRNWKFRAITGVSMGANGASMIGFRHPEAFDILGPLGGPTDWTYLTHYIRDGGMGGFGAAPAFGRSEPYKTTMEFEHPQRFDEWWYDTGDGTGGAFPRSDYADIFTDLMMSFGSIVTYNDQSPFAAPGLPLSELTRPYADRCPRDPECAAGTTPGFTIATGFYDDEFNPDGSRPVIQFCDGEGSKDRSLPFPRACDLDGNGQPDETNEGLYDDPCAQNRPMPFTWAVDLNGNGVRDAGEPIVKNFWEPYEDVGTDGLADAQEPGFDAASNPDPNRDNYDPMTNPKGPEQNWLHEDGEPYQDKGLDGVAGTPQLADGGYDFGEGNGVFDYNPNLAKLFAERNPRTKIAEASQQTLDEITLYMDAGIRDLFNFAAGGTALVGELQSRGENVRMYDDFYPVQDIPKEDANDYNFNDVDYANLGEHVYVRYGDPDADAELVCDGDGKHVGTIPQIANRLLTMLAFVTNRFPDPERTIIRPPYPLPNGTYYAPSAVLGGKVRYSIALPPGYERTQCSDGLDNDGDGLKDGHDESCASAESTSETDAALTRCNDGIDNDDDGEIDSVDADCVAGDGLSEWPQDSIFRNARFPVVMVLHGYGQSPEELQITALPFAGFMAGGTWPKSIIVFPDGFCGNNEITACNDGVDNDGDGTSDGLDDGCATSGGRSETGDRVAFCADGIDNDNDGLTDSADGGCGLATWDDEANCVQGNFYTDHASYPDGRAGGGPQYEQVILELLDTLDATYRTRRPAVFPETRD